MGEIRGQRVWKMISQMGSTGVGASLQDVSKAIVHLSPQAVIMIGVAMGTDRKKQDIGDVLVSKKLTSYEPRRLGAREVIRGDRVSSSAFLLSRCQTAALIWPQSSVVKVRYGLILSGEKLVDDAQFRAELLADEPEAIGVEMEGSGLYVACVDAGVPWIMAKGICDWGDGTKGYQKTKRQTEAAKNAAEYVAHIVGIDPPLLVPASASPATVPSDVSAHLYWLGSDLADGIHRAAAGESLSAVRDSIVQAHWHFQNAGLKQNAITDTLEHLAIGLAGQNPDPNWYQNAALRHQVLQEVMGVKQLVNIHIDTLGGDKFVSHPPTPGISGPNPQGSSPKV